MLTVDTRQMAASNAPGMNEGKLVAVQASLTLLGGLTLFFPLTIDISWPAT